MEKFVWEKTYKFDISINLNMRHYGCLLTEIFATWSEIINYRYYQLATFLLRTTS